MLIFSSTRHSRASGNPGVVCAELAWIPAFAGMTDSGRLFVSWIATDVFSKEGHEGFEIITPNFVLLASFVVRDSLGST